jgi:hypothetical protein
MTDLRAYLQTIANIAECEREQFVFGKSLDDPARKPAMALPMIEQRLGTDGARSVDPIEAQAADAILRRDLPRGLAIGGRPSYADSRDPR